jgi:hypothetical protein
VNGLRAWLGQEPPLGSLHPLELIPGLEHDEAMQESDSDESDSSELDSALQVMQARTKHIESALMRGGGGASLSRHSIGGSDSEAAARALREAMGGAVLKR